MNDTDPKYNSTEINEEVDLDLLKEKLSDRWWRLNNLYYIKDKKGKKILFKPNIPQTEIYNELWFFTIIPKARQLGITTFFAILYLDQVLFSRNKSAGIIAHRQEDMKKIFRNKIRFAWDNLHPWIKETIGEPNTDSAYELVFPNGSNIFVSMSTRSASIQFLHISEFGYICQRFPEKAEEIVTGAMNSVEQGGIVSIESTAAGREGYFYDFAMKAHKLQQEGRELTQMDFKLFFFPWWIEPGYTMEANFAIPREMESYFDLLKSKHGITLTDGQKRWYVKKKELNMEKMFSEYPSTLDEAFSLSVEGSYYAKEMNKVYLEKRIQILPYDPTLPVDTWWDLGMNDENAILITQTKGPQIRFIDCYTNSGEGLAHYYGVLKDKKDQYGYRFGSHNFPHDINVQELGTGITRYETLYNLGMRNMRVAPKAAIQDGIDKVRTLFPRFWFDEYKCQKLHEALFNYRRDYDAKLGVWKDKPRHDASSHFADAVRVLAMLWKEYLPLSDSELAQSEQAFFG